jgi:anti-sigma regulatory factor (Ser/Thr protein kinase)
VAVELSINLERDASAVAVARRAVERHFDGALDGRRISELALIVSELVTNAVVHGRGAITLVLQRDGDIARGEVIDEGGGFENQVRELGPHDIGGRGLVIVEALARRWGIHEGTTHVWFELDARHTNPELTEPELGEGQRPDALNPSSAE